MLPTRPFRRVLVANRGEIAVRVMRACGELGLETVAVYSEADRTAPHVRLATRAEPIGPAPASASYLSVERLLEAARRSGAEAVHPGYGFLSENADFARAVIDAGLVWVGPPPEAIEAMGSKTRARQRMEDAGVPVVPGTVEPVEDGAALREVARRIGFPVMLKAAAGGGGKGMRLVHRPEDLASALERARSEAGRSFGDAAVYVEKAIVRPRHVEVQVLADAHGRVVHLGERDCSIQRRHQKVVEETPCPVLDEATRARLCEVAVRAARAVDYVGAGTVEFLYQPGEGFWFLEMNTRLQVEHPITEMVTGVDLCRLQLQVAMGEPLPFDQDGIRPRGHAIECRVYAEDPARGFMPSPGRIATYREPGGPGIRVDSGVAAGVEVPMHYDPLIAKLIAWGGDREEALARCDRALREFRVGGIPTTLGFFRRVLADPDFRAGDYSTAFLAEHDLGAPSAEHVEIAAIAAAVAWDRRRVRPTPRPDSTSAWRRIGRWRDLA